MAALPDPETSSSTRFESVLEAVRAAILAGEFEPGERLHEVKLTTLLGVSRTPSARRFRNSHRKGCSITRQTVATPCGNSQSTK